MCTSKRYAHNIDACMDARVVEGVMRTGSPDTLNTKQPDLANEPMTRLPQARHALATAARRVGGLTDTSRCVQRLYAIDGADGEGPHPRTNEDGAFALYFRGSRPPKNGRADRI